MSGLFIKLLHGIVLETEVKSVTGKFLYSDFATGRGEKNTMLNDVVKYPLIGIVAGVARVGLAIIHTFGHLIGALLTFKVGHLFHASKGVVEGLRGIIEATPVIGRIFANMYNFNAHTGDCRSWWMIKIYNPQERDGLDQYMGNWEYFPPEYYYKA